MGVSMAMRGFFAGVLFMCEVALLAGCGGSASAGSNAGSSDSTDAATTDAATTDAASADTASADTTTVDAATTDTATADTATADTATADTATTDAATADTATADTATTDAATVDAATTDAATVDAATAVDPGCPIDPGFACNAGKGYTCANNAPPNGLVCESVGGGSEGTSYCCLQSTNSCKSTGSSCSGGNVTVACTGSDTPFSISDSIACSMMSGNRYCCGF
jgi:hypothetical protein